MRSSNMLKIAKSPAESRKQTYETEAASAQILRDAEDCDVFYDDSPRPIPHLSILQTRWRKTSRCASSDLVRSWLSLVGRAIKVATHPRAGREAVVLSLREPNEDPRRVNAGSPLLPCGL